MTLNQYMNIELEILKDISVTDASGKETVAENVKFTLSLPYGLPWSDAEAICDDFKLALQDMKKQKQEADAKAKADKDAEVAAAVAALREKNNAEAAHASEGFMPDPVEAV